MYQIQCWEQTARGLTMKCNCMHSVKYLHLSEMKVTTVKMEWGVRFRPRQQQLLMLLRMLYSDIHHPHQPQTQTNKHILFIQPLFPFRNLQIKSPNFAQTPLWYYDNMLVHKLMELVEMKTQSRYYLDFIWWKRQWKGGRCNVVFVMLWRLYKKKKQTKCIGSSTKQRSW